MRISNALRATAANWLIELECAESPAELWLKLWDWLQQHPDHKEAYLQVERAWHALDGVLGPSWADGNPETSLLSVSIQPKARKTS